MAQIASKGPYTKGLHDLGNGCYAWLQPDGSWGWSNAGLVVDSGEALLVDTLFDLAACQSDTANLLAASRPAEAEALLRRALAAQEKLSSVFKALGADLVNGQHNPAPVGAAAASLEVKTEVDRAQASSSSS